MSSPATPMSDVSSIHLGGPKLSKLKVVNTAANHVVTAIRDGLTSLHHYEDLRANGVPHATACEKSCTFSS